jgi:hypothetical protein
MLSHRLQVLVDPRQYELLRQEAARRETTIGALVRTAIDQTILRPDTERKREAYERLMSMRPIPVPEDPADLEREVEELYGRMPDE